MKTPWKKGFLVDGNISSTESNAWHTVDLHKYLLSEWKGVVEVEDEEREFYILAVAAVIHDAVNHESMCFFLCRSHSKINAIFMSIVTSV